MAFNRPLINSQWAQTAAPEDIKDPDTFQPTDPAYPNPVPLQFKAGWLVNPRQRVKQPNEWINFWYNGVDRSLTNHYESTNVWDAKIAYTKGAIVTHGGLIYVAVAASKNVSPTSAMTTPWNQAKFGMSNAASATSTINAYVSKVDQHIAKRDDPHNTTPAQINGYSKAEIDQKVQTIQDSANAHIARQDNPHAVDYADINSLGAVPGGTFTGKVGMLRMGVPGMDIEYTTAQMKMAVGARSTGVKSDVALKDDQILIHNNNFGSVNIRANPRFAIPAPVVQLPLAIDLHLMGTDVVTNTEYTSVAAVTYTNKAGVSATAPINTPAFSRAGLVIQAAANPKLTLSGPIVGMTMVAVATVDGVRKKATATVFNNTDVLTYFAPVSTIKDICIWAGTLTKEQLAAIGV